MVKKKNLERIFFIILVCLFLLFGKHIPFVKNLWVEDSKTCEVIFENLTLQSVSGIEDIDTGLLSGGSVYRKDLLFEDGRILQFRTYNLPDLILGRQYNYEICNYRGGLFGINSKTKKTLSLIENKIKLENNNNKGD